MTEKIDCDSSEDLSEQFVTRCIATWLKFKQSPDDLARAMLSGSLNLMLEEIEPNELSLLLIGLAHQISPGEGAGHA